MADLTMEKVLAISMAVLGVKVERMEERESCIIFTASIPETLDASIVPEKLKKKENTTRLPGTTILPGLEYLMGQHSGKRCVFNYSVRSGEVWSKNDVVRADTEMRKRIEQLERRW